MADVPLPRRKPTPPELDAGMTLPIPDLNLNLNQNPLTRTTTAITTGNFFSQGVPQHLRGQGPVLGGAPVLAGGFDMVLAAALILGVVYVARRYG